MRSYIEELYNKNIKFEFSADDTYTRDNELENSIKCNPSKDRIIFHEENFYLIRPSGELETYNYNDLTQVSDSGEVAHTPKKINGTKVYKLPTR